ncbi:LAMI_0A06194g1_1 [Lachancea mirantina]|uniref:LAMI_0A06194g1_1 n=1 Tax=Lachancea mirantina TaxID=1230905 RepID=A0A1G4IQ00_9SACH|nr:LAMI_0A06194g1_1 [Lachancea mirantina]
MTHFHFIKKGSKTFENHFFKVGQPYEQHNQGFDHESVMANILTVWILFVAVFESYFVSGQDLAKSSARDSRVSLMRNAPPDDACPPCFNCMLPIFECKQFSTCNSFTGKCECLEGFGGDDCSTPLCGALSDGNTHRPIRDNSTEICECKDGWSGINCNVCQDDTACDAFMPEGTQGTCYKGGMIVNKFHQGCDVTNKKIIQILNGKKPQVTFSCNRTSQVCDFQFWIDQKESFYCGLSACEFEFDLNNNASHYNCRDVSCRCLPGEMLCGQSGSIDISEFLKETIKGPGDFSCDLHTRKCKFSEPSMNDLISTVFGDPYITLVCESGECLHYSEIPGYEPPSKDRLTLFQKLGLTFGFVGICLVSVFAAFLISKSPLFNNNSISLDEDDDNDFDFLKDGVKSVLTFEDMSYVIGSGKDARKVLTGANGIVKPGEILAIMGGSGAGKTTLLDLLAMKMKTGRVSGSIRVNGKKIDREQFSKFVGFVDQDDFLLPTLTVYETVLNSALLRLPRHISFQSKQKRVYQVLDELRILDIKDRVIGDEFERGISGGEKRRVSIACELVTSPSILFLDEPTSGLDSNNANNVIECLVRLALHYNRTLVLSIHQPRSNIFKSFDKLILLSEGETVYSGNAREVSDFLRNNGYICPADYNIADFLIDITFEPGKNRSTRPADLEANAFGDAHTVEHTFPSENRNSVSTATQREWEHYAVHRDELRSVLGSTMSAEDNAGDSLRTQMLHSFFEESPQYSQLKEEIERTKNQEQSPGGIHNKETKKASFAQQLYILSSRSFKNIYRNPKLLLGNYLLTLFLGLFLGVLYYNVENDISGFQNRLGLFFFILTYFGFLTFTGLSSFSLERLIFLKERSNNYYSPMAYYISKMISDVIPLRIVPPILLALVIYPLVGLNMQENAFCKFVVLLCLFNLAISLEILSVGIFFEDLNNSIVVSVLILLGSLLFSGLFINTSAITNVTFKYLKNLSVFYYAYESLIINEVKTLILREKNTV